MDDAQFVELPVGVHELFEDGLGLNLAQPLLLPQQFGNVFPLAELGNDVEVVFGLEDIVELEQVDWTAGLYHFEDVDLVVHELPAQFVLFFEVDDLHSHWLIYLHRDVLVC